MNGSTLLPAAERERLARFLGMMGSAHDGEVLNAAKFANRIVRTKGLTWIDVVQPVQPAPPNPQTYGYVPADWPQRWRWVACACLDTGSACLTRDDKKLLRRIVAYAKPPTAPQLWVLHAIADRVLLRRRGR